MNAALRKRLEAQLDRVDKAISDIEEGGQSVAFSSSGGSQSVTQANLRELYDRQEKLQNQLYGSGLSARSAIGR